MRVAVILDSMATRGDLAHQRWILARTASDAEETGAHASRIEQIEHPRSRLGIRPVIEGQCDLPLCSRRWRQAHEVRTQEARARHQSRRGEHCMIGDQGAN